MTDKRFLHYWPFVRDMMTPGNDDMWTHSALLAFGKGNPPLTKDTAALYCFHESAVEQAVQFVWSETQ